MDFRLCVVTDRKLAGGRGIADVVHQSLEGGAGVIQLREKESSGREFLESALEIKRLFRNYPGKLFIINDRADIAFAAGADGVHLGRDDIPVSMARKVMGPGAVIGASVSSAEDALRAEAEGAAYLGAGAVFPTATKTGAAAIGLEGLRKITAAVSIPVIAIGGIKAENAGEVIKAGASGAAVVSEVMISDNPRFAVSRLLGVISAALD